MLHEAAGQELRGEERYCAVIHSFVNRVPLELPVLPNCCTHWQSQWHTSINDEQTFRAQSGSTLTTKTNSRYPADESILDQEDKCDGDVEFTQDDAGFSDGDNSDFCIWTIVA